MLIIETEKKMITHFAAQKYKLGTPAQEKKLLVSRSMV
jgi:hypothetical protein